MKLRIALLLLLFASLACNLPGINTPVSLTPEIPAQAPDWIFTPVVLSGDSDAPPPPPPEQSTPQTEVSQSPSGTLKESPPYLYYTQSGDSLGLVARRFEVQPFEITSPNEIAAQGLLPANQLLVIPRVLGETTPNTLLLPDSDFVYSPTALDFDVKTYVAQAGGYLSEYREWLGSSGWTDGATIVERVSIENSINPRLLLSLLQYQSGWVLGRPGNLAQSEYPMGLIDNNQNGLYKQLVWAVNRLHEGYYGWRSGSLLELQFPEGKLLRIAPELNAASAALQFFFALQNSGDGWRKHLSIEEGLPAVHQQMFGNPWLRAQELGGLFPADLRQPTLILPFVREQIWSFTGGPHGAWDPKGPRAAIDFAPGSSEPGCTVSYNSVLAAASGLVVRDGEGVLVLDLDGDGYEQTGWVLFYLHLAERGRVKVGTQVEQGDPLGYPSCEGGASTGTHVHIARKYNGEWILADGALPFVLGGWQVHAGAKPYEGYLQRGGTKIEASPLGTFATRILRTPEDP